MLTGLTGTGNENRAKFFPSVRKRWVENVQRIGIKRVFPYFGLHETFDPHEICTVHCK